MSYDLGVWYPHERLGNAEAAKLYVGLCQGTAETPPAHPAVDAFYEELTAKYPEIDTVPDYRIYDHDELRTRPITGARNNALCLVEGRICRRTGAQLGPQAWLGGLRPTIRHCQLSRFSALGFIDTQSGEQTVVEVVVMTRPWCPCRGLLRHVDASLASRIPSSLQSTCRQVAGSARRLRTTRWCSERKPAVQLGQEVDALGSWFILRAVASLSRVATRHTILGSSKYPPIDERHSAAPAEASGGKCW